MLRAAPFSSLAQASPAELILVARPEAKVAPVIEEINTIDPSIRATFVAVDVAKQDSVRAAAASILEDPKIPKIDVVINCAGIMYLPEFTTDAKGNELQFSSSHIGHFLLANLLMPKILAAGENARIINIASHRHQISDVWQSKTANILFPVELARQLKNRGIVSLSVHPGSIANTGLFNYVPMTEFDSGDKISRKNTGLPFAIDTSFKTVSQGCSSAVAAALSPELAANSGSYIQNCQVGTPREYALYG
ncbi:uncharacterized protein LY79DRAFT_582267 [Colletotrichum navitas]|uniref:Short-chain dehydrogenase n=1 Tax=Colletotrichum navitas TaxID=681940 RepID=A0AAD8PSF2_9PEZI|nr:uncharacterized protein LY79DRAFT_582267 [Colletotrichum navitas]KAK1579889.1 hypothetical protein LY79DRAFT_582267 [Colletotrichum navitas]